MAGKEWYPLAIALFVQVRYMKRNAFQQILFPWASLALSHALSVNSSSAD